MHGNSSNKPSDANSPMAGPLGGVLAAFASLRAWAYGHWLRSVVVAATILAVIAVTMAGWAYLATMALHSGGIDPETLLALVDEEQIEDARTAVSEAISSRSLAKRDYGTPLFVLGIIKMHDAEAQANPERIRTEYLVASRYLNEAKIYGFPPGRDSQGLLHLAESLIKSQQVQVGLEALDELFAQGGTKADPNLAEGHYLAASTYLSLPEPDAAGALPHAEAILGDGLNSAEDTPAVLLKADCLARLGRFDDARKALDALSGATACAAAVELQHGKCLLAEHKTLSNSHSPESPSASLAEKLASAMTHLRRAAEIDQGQSDVTRQANYQMGLCFERQGDLDRAIRQFIRTRQLFSDHSEGFAAGIAEARIMQRRGDYAGAAVAYGLALNDFRDMHVRGGAVSSSEVRDQITADLRELVEQRHFEEALQVVEHCYPLFSRADQLDLKGGVFEHWGRHLLNSSAPTGDDENRQKIARQKLRAAGVAYERLAELRFSSKSYTSHLWRSADNYFDGHSFSSAIRLLEQYLEYEPELRNATALLRLGQAQFALRRVPEAVRTLEECIEFYPTDDASYQARIDCAKAYWHQGKMARAEELLQQNLSGSSLTPESREWKDSLFELGLLWYETQQFQQAISTLEEAVERYPSDDQHLVAKYVIGECYRRWAQQMLEQSQEARTTSEREKQSQLAAERLLTALKSFADVQVSITLKSPDLNSDPVLGTMLRNCYMLEGTVLFDLGRYKEAIEAYSNVASLYPDNPFVLETFVQIANCYRRLGQDVKARGAIQQAQIVLDSLPPESDFASTSALSRSEWKTLLTDMSQW